MMTLGEGIGGIADRYKQNKKDRQEITRKLEVYGYSGDPSSLNLDELRGELSKQELQVGMKEFKTQLKQAKAQTEAQQAQTAKSRYELEQARAAQQQADQQRQGYERYIKDQAAGYEQATQGLDYRGPLAMTDEQRSARLQEAGGRYDPAAVRAGQTFNRYGFVPEAQWQPTSGRYDDGTPYYQTSQGQVQVGRQPEAQQFAGDAGQIQAFAQMYTGGDVEQAKALYAQFRKDLQSADPMRQAMAKILGQQLEQPGPDAAQLGF